MADFFIANRKIGRDAAPFVIAEMSGNHNHSLDRALAIVEAAAKSGAHALKLQTYTPDTMTLDIREREFFISDPGSLWSGTSLYDLYKQAYTPWEWHKTIFDHAQQLGMIAFSTPFDESAVDFLEGLESPCYKVASFENTDLPLIRRIARTGKPMIISTGMASIAELAETVDTARKAGCSDLVLLKCTSSYPATPEDSNIRTIAHMRELFGCEIGLSDHTRGIGAALASVAFGSTVIEKHFTLSRADGGVDSAFSLEPKEMASLVYESKQAWESLGRICYGVMRNEEKSLVFRRSLYIVEDMKPGETLSEKNMRAIRPGLGLSPKFYDLLLNKPVKEKVMRGTPLSWDLLV